MMGGVPRTSDATVERFLEALETGISREAAAAQARLPRSTMHRLLKRGQDALAATSSGEPEDVPELERWYAEFADAVERAWDLGEAALCDRMHRLAQAGLSTWREPLTELERTRPREWGSSRKIEFDGAPVQLIVEGRPARDVGAVGQPVGAGPVGELAAANGSGA